MKVFIFMLKLYHHFKLSLTLFAYIHFTATLFTLDPAHIRFDLISASVLHDFHINADALWNGTYVQQMPFSMCDLPTTGNVSLWDSGLKLEIKAACADVVWLQHSAQAVGNTLHRSWCEGFRTSFTSPCWTGPTLMWVWAQLPWLCEQNCTKSSILNIFCCYCLKLANTQRCV